MYFKKTLATLILFFTLGNIALASTNKENLIISTDSVISQINSLETDYKLLLENTLKDLVGDYNNLFISSGYTQKTIDYLADLGKIDLKFRNDTFTEYKKINTELTNLLNLEIIKLNDLKAKISLNYSTISDTEKTALEKEITIIKNKYFQYKTDFSSKIKIFKDNYENTLNLQKEQILTTIKNSETDIKYIEDFSNKFAIIKTDIEKFKTNYANLQSLFSTSLLDVKIFTDTKMKFYTDLLRTELEELRDVNLKATTSLNNNIDEINYFINLEVENFGYKLLKDISSISNVFSGSVDLNLFTKKINEIETLAFDEQHNVKPKIIIENKDLIFSIKSMYSTLQDSNNEIINLLGDSSTKPSLEDIKTMIENKIISLYNNNYEKYRDGLTAKLKDKINLTSLENKNISALSEIINIKYGIFVSDLKNISSLDLIYDKLLIFDKLLVKYSIVKNTDIKAKIAQIRVKIYELYLSKMTENIKYLRYKILIPKYEKVLSDFSIKLNEKYGKEKTLEKINLLNTKINELLLNKNLSAKTTFMLINVKLFILRELSK